MRNNPAAFVTFGDWSIDPARFWTKVEKRSPMECWHWLGYVGQNGYGQFGIRTGGKTVARTAHRVAYLLARGDFPVEYSIDHMCHNRRCVNPAHLRAIPQKNNCENHSGPTARNNTGVRGVSRRGRYFDIAVKHNGVLHRAYGFTDLAAAERAVIALRNSLWTHNDIDRQETANA